MQVKVGSPEESGLIVAHENVFFCMDITTEWAQSLQIMKMRNAELYLKEATVIRGFHPLGARLPELASKLEGLDCSNFFNSKSKLSTDYSYVGWAMIRNCRGSLRWDDRSRRY